MSAISRSRPVDKSRAITQWCAGRTVLHVGCANSPNTVRRMRMGTLLHADLVRVAAAVDGIDIDEEGLAEMRRAGFASVHRADAKSLGGPVAGLRERYDVVVLGDVIEHDGDPQGLLAAALTRVAPHGEIIVSVPNAFYLWGFVRVLLGNEVTHPEHVAYYSQSNLRELFARLGLEIREMRGYYEPSAGRSPIVRALKAAERGLLAVFPGVSAGIVCRAGVA